MTEIVKGEASESQPGDVKESRWKRKGDSWDRWGRKVSLRLSLKRPEELRVLEEYDRRSALRGRDDKDFLKACLLVGFSVLMNPNSVPGRLTGPDMGQDKEEAKKAPAEVSALPAKALLGDLMNVRTSN